MVNEKQRPKTPIKEGSTGPMYAYITDKGLENLMNYKYRSCAWTPYEHIINNWWMVALKMMPLWMAPNLITLLALCAIFMVILTGMFLEYLNGSAFECPWWYAYLASFAFFLYQTLDAIDGKQARRTQNSSPLGQLFDHGCDALNTIFINYISARVLNINTSENISIVIYCNMICFYLAQWEEKHTSVLRSSGFLSIGVTERKYSPFFHLYISK